MISGFDRSIETTAARTWRGQHDIVHTVLRATPPSTLDEARDHIDAVNTVVAGGDPCPLLCDIRAMRERSPGEVRDYYATDEAMSSVSKVAILSDSMLTQVLGNFFVRLHRPPRPTRVFTDEDRAMDWLRNSGEPN